MKNVNLIGIVLIAITAASCGTDSGETGGTQASQLEDGGRALQGDAPACQPEDDGTDSGEISETNAEASLPDCDCTDFRQQACIDRTGECQEKWQQYCAGLVQSACMDESELCEPIIGRRVTATEPCAEEPELVACIAQNSWCVAACLGGRNPSSGELWAFQGGCIPFGWWLENEESEEIMLMLAETCHCGNR